MTPEEQIAHIKKLMENTDLWSTEYGPKEGNGIFPFSVLKFGEYNFVRYLPKKNNRYFYENWDITYLFGNLPEDVQDRILKSMDKLINRLRKKQRREYLSKVKAKLEEGLNKLFDTETKGE